MMTEDEAKTKWCPHARYSGEQLEGEDSPAANRWYDNGDAWHENPEPCRCIASECMSWRWLYADPNDSAKGGILLPRSQWPGYCGLAGKP